MKKAPGQKAEIRYKPPKECKTIRAGNRFHTQKTDRLTTGELSPVVNRSVLLTPAIHPMDDPMDIPARSCRPAPIDAGSQTGPSFSLSHKARWYRKPDHIRCP